MLAISNAQRILDHRAFLSGEIEGFCVGFEKKRSDVEVETLFTIREHIGVTQELAEKLSAKENKETFDGVLSAATTLLDKIEKSLESRSEAREPSQSLLESRANRENKKAELLKSVEHSKERIQNSVDQKKEELDEFYTDLELRLNIVS